jgi:hypothetical protein
MAAMELKQKDGIYDAFGRWLAPLAGNEPLPPAPEKLCAHGRLCQECTTGRKAAA